MFTLNCKGHLLQATRPLAMGIINITPDSFFENSRQQSEDAILYKAEQMLLDGASILDIGGQSTRPGSVAVSAEEEIARIIKPIAALHKRFPEAVISVDTFYSNVAAEAVATGASIINDISGGKLDEAMLETTGRLETPFICMHMQGTPQTMQQFAQYDDVTLSVLDYFIERIDACKKAGIKDVIIDPGFGFSKTTAHNLLLLKNMPALAILDKPILAGLSRKGMVYKTLGTTADRALNGTTVFNTLALQNGAGILRVHDVKEAMEAITLFQSYQDA
ncbi:MAG: dihydropteroate synthase [Chitinophagaceae bacterium]